MSAVTKMKKEEEPLSLPPITTVNLAVKEQGCTYLLHINPPVNAWANAVGLFWTSTDESSGWPVEAASGVKEANGGIARCWSSYERLLTTKRSLLSLDILKLAK